MVFPKLSNKQNIMKKSFSIFLFLFSTLTLVFAQDKEQYIVASPTLSMRSGESKEKSIVATLSKNDAVRILKANTNGWWQVDFNGTQGYVISQFLKKRSNEGWVSHQYQSGDTPECDNNSATYDINLDNHLKITVNSYSDVVLKLMKMDKSGDICIRTVFIESGDFTLIRNIPEGKYYLKIAYGKDWREKKVGGTCVGRFVEDAQYELGKERLNYKVIQLKDRLDIPSYGLSLGMKSKPGVEATFNTNEISEAEFNK